MLLAGEKEHCDKDGECLKDSNNGKCDNLVDGRNIHRILRSEKNNSEDMYFDFESRCATFS